MFNRSFLRQRIVRELPQVFLQYSATAAGDRMGTSCALSSDGATLIVGQPSDDNAGGGDAGSAVVFIRSGKTWTQQAVLTYSAGAAGDYFGWSVALSSDGNTAICGVPYDDRDGLTNVGSAVVFTRSGATWTQEAILGGFGYEDDNAFFGWSVALSGDGNKALIGAIGVFLGDQRGLVNVSTRSGVTWTNVASIFSSVAAASDQFGYSVALSNDGNQAVVGAPFDDNAKGTNAGSMVFFDLSGGGGSFTEVKIITPTVSGNNQYLGKSVAISGDGRWAMGVQPASGTGYIEIVERRTTDNLWYSTGTVSVTGATTVALDTKGTLAIIGAANATTPLGGVDAGQLVGIYRTSDGYWRGYLAALSQITLRETFATSNDFLGSSVAVSGDGTVAVGGAEGVGSNNGGAAVFYTH